MARRAFRVAVDKVVVMGNPVDPEALAQRVAFLPPMSGG